MTAKLSSARVSLLGPSLYAATGIPVVVVWSCTFAPHGVKALRSHTNAEIIVCLDNDASGAGQTAAQHICATYTNCIDQHAAEFVGKDYNDIEQSHGAAEVRRQVMKERFGLRGNSLRQFTTQPQTVSGWSKTCWKRARPG